jgi:hypothetical protein
VLCRRRVRIVESNGRCGEALRIVCSWQRQRSYFGEARIWWCHPIGWGVELQRLNGERSCFAAAFSAWCCLLPSRFSTILSYDWSFVGYLCAALLTTTAWVAHVLCCALGTGGGRKPCPIFRADDGDAVGSHLLPWKRHHFTPFPLCNVSSWVQTHALVGFRPCGLLSE